MVQAEHNNKIIDVEGMQKQFYCHQGGEGEKDLTNLKKYLLVGLLDSTHRRINNLSLMNLKWIVFSIKDKK